MNVGPRSTKIPTTTFNMRADLKNLTNRIHDYWKTINLQTLIFQKRNNLKNFTMLGGPPYANGNLHTGHYLNLILKDMVLKYNYYVGKNIHHYYGFDCHGLPIEMKVTKKKVDTSTWLTVNEHIGKCRSLALHNVVQQELQLNSLDIWYESEYFITLQWTSKIYGKFINMLENGYIYMGRKPMPWSISLGTTIPDSEIIYKSKVSQSVYLSLPTSITNVHLIVWTTTAWTLIDNCCMSYNKNLKYTQINTSSISYVVSYNLVNILVDKLNLEVISIEDFSSDLFEQLTVQHPALDKQVNCYHGDHVDDHHGSGIVHTAPAHGEEDFEVSIKHNLTFTESVDEFGFYKTTHDTFNDLHIFKDQETIINLIPYIIYTEEYEHSYPFIDRSSEPMIYRSTLQVFADIKKVSTDISSISLKPMNLSLHTNMLNRKEWCLSRNRFWGVPMGIFYDTHTLEIKNSPKLNAHMIREMIKQPYIFLNEEYARQVGSLYIDTDELINLSYYVGVLDVWFDSACVSSISKQRNKVDGEFMMLEGVDQCRGWFQSSIWMSKLTQEELPCTQILAHCFVVDHKGHKLSKSKGNAIVVDNLIKKYGMELLRLRIAGADYQSEITIGEEVLKQYAKQYRKFRNVMRYCISIIETYELHYLDLNITKMDIMEQYYYQEICILEKKYHYHMSRYEFHFALQGINNFIVHFSKYYCESIKDILYTAADNFVTKQDIIWLCRLIFKKLLMMLRPFIPVTTEEIYQHIKPFIEEWNMETIHTYIFQESLSSLDEHIEFPGNMIHEINVKVMNKEQKFSIVSNTSQLQSFFTRLYTDYNIAYTNHGFVFNKNES